MPKSERCSYQTKVICPKSEHVRILAFHCTYVLEINDYLAILYVFRLFGYFGPDSDILGLQKYLLRIEMNHTT